MQETAWLAEEMLVSQGLCGMYLGIYLLDRHRVSQSAVGWPIGWLVH
jgi:hypothetical protein